MWAWDDWGATWGVHERRKVITSDSLAREGRRRRRGWTPGVGGGVAQRAPTFAAYGA